MNKSFNQLTNRSAQIYSVSTKFMKSAIGFGFVSATMVCLFFVHGLVTEGMYANPLFNNSYDWSALVIALGVPVLVLSLIYALISTVISRYSNRVLLAQDGVKIEKGLLIRKIEFIPYSKIKAVEVIQSPLQRILNFTKLSINYGGWESKDIELVSEDNAEDLQYAVARGATSKKIRGLKSFSA